MRSSGPLLCRRTMLAAGGACLAAIGLAGRLGAVGRVPARFDLKTPDGRSLTVSEWKPKGRQKGVILFSHGAASSPIFYESMIAPMAAAGYHVLAPLHVDSIAHPHTKAYPGLASWKARLEDMAALLAHIGDAPFVAAGHSYGGLVALTLGGAAAVPPAGWKGPLVPRLAQSVIAFSPPAPVPALCTEQGYAALAVPALIQTGTKDILPGMGPQVEDAWKGHLAPFNVAQPGKHRYGLVLEGVDHYFGGAICRYDLPGPRQTAQLEQANRIVDLFLGAFGFGDRPDIKALDAALSDEYPARLMRR